ncbi:hypothetical protein RclHR1_03070004 [Rhizophagus clarus]|uniref:Alpha/beta hydrolase n=1 Tax=Rhizophagus clarus TaxID=94130 RepID=A0A2Z6S115_9GLOM|nr:hypothetical protein RclHR1_03070004 [Rhizophagus clarus]GES93433.1 alpha/beta hydrolase [Rhizophagus clarus]
MDFILPVLYCALVLALKIPLAILDHCTSFFFFKKGHTPPSLYQRVTVSIFKTFQLYLPLWLIRELHKSCGTMRVISHEQKEHWVKKLDANNEQDGWEGYLIANDVNHSEIGKDVDMIILYAHGGGYICGDALLFLATFIDWIRAWELSYGARTQILSLEYQLAPEHPFPAARENMLACYHWLINEKKISPSKIAFAGDSAGGNLAIISAIRLVNQLHVEPPVAVLLISPCVNGITNAESYISNDPYDCINITWFHRCLDLYLGDSNFHPSNPMISPVFENQLSGLPKVWACVGGYEVFLDDVKLFIEKLLSNNVEAELTIEDANIHDYAVVKLLSRNGAYDNNIKHIGKFLYDKKK